jgi:hypothetical protein
MTDALSRRAVLTTTLAALFAGRISRSAAAAQVPRLLDHILLGCNDLERGIAYVEQRTGVRAKFGGVHPGAGTQNALLSLGPNRYLEIIAPDPQQPASADARDLQRLTEDPAIVGWAAHRSDLAAFTDRLTQQGFVLEGPMPGSRKRPDGRILTWKVVRLKNDATRLLPFFIEWSRDSIHPSVDAPQGCRLLRFQAFAPDEDARAASGQITALDLDLPVAPAHNTVLVATIEGPRGQLEITS